MEAKGVALLQGLSGNGGLKEAVLLRQDNANVRGDEQQASTGESGWDQGATQS